MGSRVGRRSKCGRDLWLFWEGCVPEGARTWGESPRGGMGPVVLFALESSTAVAQKFELSGDVGRRGRSPQCLAIEGCDVRVYVDTSAGVVENLP